MRLRAALALALAAAVFAACTPLRRLPVRSTADRGPAKLPAAGAAPSEHHRIRARLEPERHWIELEDYVRPGGAPSRRRRFVLDAGLRAESLDPCCTVAVLPGDAHGEEGRRAWEIRARQGLLPAELAIAVRGSIDHPPRPEPQEYARGFARTPGTIDPRGVFLSGATAWLPRFGQGLLTFDLTVDLPAGWSAISQGKQLKVSPEPERAAVRWKSDLPMEEVYLVAGPWTEYRRRHGQIELAVFLRQADPVLAARYLDAGGSYLDMYSKLIGPYPYAKLAVVENFWETGYGMPSFMVLGSRILRFPFILHSSYPHEILHNWWGNAVYVELERGNWSEGLTAYLADHLVKESRGLGADYRRDALVRYRSYVRAGRDFPLREFRERHSPASEAVGYGKGMMLWHMLRRRLGDERFVTGLRRLYSLGRFGRVSFDQIAELFSQVAGEDLRPWFRQWIERVGAPALSVTCRAEPGGRVRLELRQQTSGPPYHLRVPVAVTVEGERKARWFELALDGPRGVYDLEVGGRALRADVDPLLDVFRRLAPGEVPPTVGDVLGAPVVTLVVPADGPLAPAWRKLAVQWAQQAGAHATIVDDAELLRWPEEGAVWLLGAANRWVAPFERWLEGYGARRAGNVLVLGGDRVHLDRQGFVVVAAPEGQSERAAGWVGAPSVAAIEALAEKIPHYGRYSYLAFRGPRAVSVLKGRWPAGVSSLAQPCTESAGATPRRLAARAELPERSPLARAAPLFDPGRLLAHVRFLASDALEGRGVGTDGLDAAAAYIARAFRRAGLQGGGEGGSYFDEWVEPDGPGGHPVRLRNVIAVLPGTNPDWSRQSVVVAAHYDHLGRGWPGARPEEAGEIFNGADDNASGVAVLIELAKDLARAGALERTVVFAAFSGEEWSLRGSRRYVRAQRRWPAEQAIAMINIDTVGRLGHGPLLVLGADSALEWPHIVAGLSYVTGIKAKAVLDDPGGSDQASFREVGVPAVQVFTGAHSDYHRPSDDVARIDAEGLAKVAEFVKGLVIYLAARPEPLTLAGHGPESTRQRGHKRRASLGTVPDYGYSGSGVRVQSVVPGSPAARAGIAPGDVLVTVGGRSVENVRDLAETLAGFQPAATVQVEVVRSGRRVRFEVELGGR